MSDGMVIEVKGLDQAIMTLGALYKNSPSEFGQALREEMDDVMMESQAECPYDYENPHTEDGVHLRDTGKVEGPTYTSNTLMIILSYVKEYAKIVHENPGVRHHWPTKWKYLEDPLTRRIPQIEQRIAARIEMMSSGNFYPLGFTSEDIIQGDYYRWAHGTIGGRNTLQSWGKAWHSGNVYPLKIESDTSGGVL